MPIQAEDDPGLINCGGQVAVCNFAVMYFFPMYFETVMLTSASTAGSFIFRYPLLIIPFNQTNLAGAHLLPNSLSMSCGSLFAGYVAIYSPSFQIAYTPLIQMGYVENRPLQGSQPHLWNRTFRSDDPYVHAQRTIWSDRAMV